MEGCGRKVAFINYSTEFHSWSEKIFPYAFPGK